MTHVEEAGYTHRLAGPLFEIYQLYQFAGVGQQTLKNAGLYYLTRGPCSITAKAISKESRVQIAHG